MREINKLIIHCSYTPPSMDIGVEEIRRWHVEENGWSDIGYHWVIRRDGTVETGRQEERQGAHVLGYNRESIGVCLVGGRAKNSNAVEANYTPRQWQTLDRLIEELLQRYPGAGLHGHRDLDGNRLCPGFDVGEWWKEAREENNVDRNVDRVRSKLKQRAEEGLRKYGVTTERTDLTRREWLQHLQDELLDGAVYVERLMAEELE